MEAQTVPCEGDGMKRITEAFTDEEHAALTKAKKKSGKKNWHDFIMGFAQ
jgi:hypothetical protein